MLRGCADRLRLLRGEPPQRLGATSRGRRSWRVCDLDPAELARARPRRFGVARHLRRCRRDAARGAARLRRHRDHGAAPPAAGRAGGAARACRPSCQKPFAPDLAGLRGDGRGLRGGRRAADGARELPLAVADAAVARAERDGGDRRRRSGAGSPSAPASTSMPAQPYLATEERFIISDLGIHVLDVARFLLRRGRDDLAATTQRVNPGIRGEDVATMLLAARERASSSVVDCSYASRLPGAVPRDAARDRGRPKGACGSTRATG